jgi:saccharopine dehydrogenase (NAD+, L-lysine-forming)
VCAEQLANNPKVDELVLADMRLDAARAMMSRVKCDKMSAKKVDGTSGNDVKRLLKGADVVVSSMPWGMNGLVLRKAMESGTDYVDFCMVVESMEEYWKLAKQCERSGITALTAMGEDPGISDSMANYAAGKLDEPIESRVMDGDSGVAEGMDFFSLWCPQDLLEETTVPAAVFRNGKMTFVPPLHEKEMYEFPPPLGLLPVYKTNHEETYLMPEFIKGLKNADFRIAIDDEFAHAAKTLRKIGMHGLKPLTVKDIKVRPLDVVCALMPRPVETAGKVKGFACIVVEVTGLKNGKKKTIKMWTIMSHEKAYKQCKTNATGYLVGVGGAVATEMLIEGDVKRKGLLVPEQLDSEKLLSRLPAKGLKVEEEIISH